MEYSRFEATMYMIQLVRCNPGYQSLREVCSVRMYTSETVRHNSAEDSDKYTRTNELKE